MNPTERPTVGPTTTPRKAPTKPAGWVYVQHTSYDPTKYVGQSKRPVWNRINEERRTFPWGADILPGRDGYTILRRVESLGNPTLDAIALDLAEAEEIARLHPTENANRPNPTVFRARLADAVGSPLPPPTFAPVGRRRGAIVGRPTVAARKARPFPWRTVVAAIVGVTWGLVGLRLSLTFPNPTVPWVVVPVAAFVGPPLTFAWWRRHVLKRRPARRRRR